METSELETLIHRQIAEQFCKELIQCDSCLVHPTKISLFWGSDIPVKRVANEYEKLMFVHIYGFDHTLVQYDKSVHKDLVIKKCKHTHRHHHYSNAINPGNLILWLKFVKFIGSPTRYFEMGREMIRSGVYGEKGRQITDLSEITSSLSAFRTLLLKLTIKSLYDNFKSKRVYKHLVSKIKSYTGWSLSFIYHVLENSKALNYFENAPKDTEYMDDDDYDLLSDEGVTRISYSSYNELVGKTMTFLYVEWSRHHSKDIQQANSLVLFKNLLNSSIASYEESNITKDFVDYIQTTAVLFELPERKEASAHDVISRLSRLEIEDGKGKNEGLEEEKKSMKEDRYQHVLCKNYKIKWMEDLNTSNVVYCFIFIYYQSIFKRLSKDDQLAIEEFEYTDDKYKNYNVKLQKMCKEIKKLENIEDAENSMYSKSRFIRLIDSFVNESFTDAFDIPDILWNMSDKHPLFTLEMTVKHSCEKYDQLTFVSSQSSDSLVIIASFLHWTQRNTRDTNLVFEDNFIYTPMSETDLGIHYTCCNANEFYPFFEKLPKFLFLHLNYNKKLKNFGREWMFKINPVFKNDQRVAHLLGIIMESKETYFCIANIELKENRGSPRSMWFLYDPVVSSEALPLSKRCIKDSMIVVNEAEYETNTHPCLLVYKIA